MRIVGILVSLLLHGLVIYGLLHIAVVSLGERDTRPPAYEIELADAPPEKESREMQAKRKEAAPKHGAAPTAQKQQKPPERRPPARKKAQPPRQERKAVPKKPPQAPAAPPAAETAAEVTRKAPEVLAPPPEPVFRPPIGPAEPVLVRNATRPDGTTVTETLVQSGRTSMAGFLETYALEQNLRGPYVPEDYIGIYTFDKGETAAIIDARERLGALLFYDFGSGLCRKLKPMSKLISTYGPSFEELEPAEGSLTFMPKKEDLELEETRLPGRVLWLPKKPPMRWGTRVRVLLREVQGPETLQARMRLVFPRDARAQALVLRPVGKGEPFEDAFAHAEILCAFGMAALLVEPSPESKTSSFSTLGRRALAALLPEFGGRPMGLWPAETTTSTADELKRLEEYDFVIAGAENSLPEGRVVRLHSATPQSPCAEALRHWKGADTGQAVRQLRARGMLR